jgi:hypothetical protein
LLSARRRWHAKFLTGACLTRSEDLWITAEAGGVYRLSGQEMKPKWCPVPLGLGKISFPRHPQPTNHDTTEKKQHEIQTGQENYA